MPAQSKANVSRRAGLQRKVILIKCFFETSPLTCCLSWQVRLFWATLAVLLILVPSTGKIVSWIVLKSLWLQSPHYKVLGVLKDAYLLYWCLFSKLASYALCNTISSYSWVYLSFMCVLSPIAVLYALYFLRHLNKHKLLKIKCHAPTDKIIVYQQAWIRQAHFKHCVFKTCSIESLDKARKMSHMSSSSKNQRKCCKFLRAPCSFLPALADRSCLPRLTNMVPTSTLND